MTYSEAVTYVTGLYKTYLGREPDSAGLDYWATGLANNQISPASATAAISCTSVRARRYTTSPPTSLSRNCSRSKMRVISRALLREGIVCHKRYFACTLDSCRSPRRVILGT